MTASGGKGVITTLEAQDDGSYIALICVDGPTRGIQHYRVRVTPDEFEAYAVAYARRDLVEVVVSVRLTGEHSGGN